MAPSVFDAELVWDAKAQLGEGPHWDAAGNCLYWVDIESRLVHKYTPSAHADEAFSAGDRVGAVVPRKSGGLIVATQHGICSFDPTTGERRLLADPESDLPGNRFNDGKCDPAGRFWAGTMSIADEPGAGALYRMDTTGQVERMIEGVSCSNGIAWSLDGTVMYYIDTPTHQVVAYDYDAMTGAIASPRTVIRFAEGEGGPDGMTIDAEGKLWIAHWGGWQVSRWDPSTGEKIAVVRVPAAHVTSCAFGGERLDVLYITSAREGISEEALQGQPLAGGLFRITPGVLGLAGQSFEG